MKCCICELDIEPQRNELGVIVWDQGHNAEPTKVGRCCDACNWSVVIPQRLRNVKNKRGIYDNSTI